MVRNNTFEQKVNSAILNNTSVDYVFKSDSTVNTNEDRKADTDGVIIFYDAKSPYKTLYGSNRMTEMVLYSKRHKVNWRIECKSHETTNLFATVAYELENVKKLKEDKFCIVLDKALCTTPVMLELAKLIKKKGLKRRVLIFTLKEFTTELQSIFN